MIIRFVFTLAAMICVVTCRGGVPRDGRSERAEQEALVPIRPGVPGRTAFWNERAKRFIYPPAFNFPAVAGAATYRFTAHSKEGAVTFDAPEPWAPLTPIWQRLPEGRVELTVQALTARGENVEVAAKRVFYRSAPFGGEVGIMNYADAGRLGLQALFEAKHVQNWLKTGAPDPSYRLYCYPSKVMGGLMRGMTKYARVAEKPADRRTAREIAEKIAAHVLSLSFPADCAYPGFPPTYALGVTGPLRQAVTGVSESRLMTNSPCDVALAFLDLYDLTHDERYLAAGKKIAETYARTQEQDGTWPLLVNFVNGKSLTPNRLVPTWVIFLFDRLAREYHLDTFSAARAKAWQYIVAHPLRTFAWDGQFEDVKPQAPYHNLAREQACDVATIICQQPHVSATDLATVRELLAFAEDQFVVWAPVSDPAGAISAGLRKNIEQWMPPCVLEQYSVYEPVARSSVVVINAYLAAYAVTHDGLLLAKARALANGLVVAQRYQIEEQHGTGEIPTWLVRRPASNWLNNSSYAADCLLRMADVK